MMTAITNSELSFFTQESRKHSSELNFLDDEIRFLSATLKESISRATTPASTLRLNLINDKLKNFGVLKTSVSEKAKKHQRKIEAEFVRLTNKSADFLKAESSHISEEIKEIKKTILSIKKDLLKYNTNLSA